MVKQAFWNPFLFTQRMSRAAVVGWPAWEAATVQLLTTPLKKRFLALGQSNPSRPLVLTLDAHTWYCSEAPGLTCLLTKITVQSSFWGDLFSEE